MYDRGSDQSYFPIGAPKGLIRFALNLAAVAFAFQETESTTTSSEAFFNQFGCFGFDLFLIFKPPFMAVVLHFPETHLIRK